MRKTKITCTLGPSTDQDGVLRELIANGMNVARFNFSHGSHEEHKGPSGQAAQVSARGAGQARGCSAGHQRP